MVTPALKEYLTKGLKEGYEQSDLTRTLLALGWGDQDITDGFYVVGNITAQKTGAALPFPPIPGFIPQKEANGEVHLKREVTMMEEEHHSHIGSLILILILIVAGAFYANRMHWIHINTDGVSHAFATLETRVSRKNTSPVAVASSTSDVLQCTTESCFDPYFQSCTSADYISTSTYWDTTYTIVSKAADGCRMSLMYTKYPQTTAENKPMVCTFTTSLPFTQSVQEVLNAARSGSSDCVGPLVSYLHTR